VKVGNAEATVLEALLNEVTALRKEVRRSGSRDFKRLLSLRQAALALGVSRTRTLPLLIERGLLKPVTVGGRKRIPSAQIEQLAFEGFDVSAPVRRRVPLRKMAPRGGAAAVKALKL
jgi:hypothetical protein